jgi:hypothetical protein
VLLAANVFILFGTKRAKVKKAFIPVLGVLAGVFVLFFLDLSGFSRSTLYLAAPVVIVLIILNLRQFTICHVCANLVRGPFFVAPKDCPNCGAKLRTN